VEKFLGISGIGNVGSRRLFEREREREALLFRAAETPFDAKEKTEEREKELITNQGCRVTALLYKVSGLKVIVR
jgi:hypothetical protein